jgi:mycothiol synthase
MFARVATREDIPILLEIFNEHQVHVAPTLGTSGPDWAEDFLQGFPDPYPGWILSDSPEGRPFAIGNLNPSANARRFQADISIRPTVNRIGEVISFFREKAEEYAKGWDFWITCNSSDQPYRQALEEQGFKVNRYYNTLRRVLADDKEPITPDGVTLRKVDLASDKDMKIWHDLRQDAFANHFGFVPRPFEHFLEIMRRDPMMRISEVHLLFESLVPAAYVWINDEAAHELTGYIANLGVAHAYQGRGYGEFLLRRVLAGYAARDFKFVDLGVDTGNESGALRLYEKMGFKKVTTWVQYEH